MPRAIKELLGLKFSRWTVVEFSGQNKRGASLWKCKCQCGAESVVRGAQLTTGKSKSCGCLTREVNSKRMRTHGMTKTAEFKAWQAMMQRCYNVKCAAYEDYGGRGIKVCSEWVSSPDRFLSDMGEKPSNKHSLHRIDNDQGYSYENCKWATSKEQANARRGNVMVDYGGDIRTFSQWSDETGLPDHTIAKRIRAGWSVKKSLTTKCRKW